jgi:thermolysin
MNRSLGGVLIAALVLIASHQTGSAQQAGILHVKATTAADLRQWDAYVTARERAGNLRFSSVRRDPALPSRTVQRLQQFHNGVPIWGAKLVRDLDGGVVVSMFGELSPDLTISTAAALSVDDATARIQRDAGSDATIVRAPELTILRRQSGEVRLAYQAVVSQRHDVSRVFVDANTGAQLLRFSEIARQSAVGSGTGVLGDTKKVSALLEARTYFADDQLRPPFLSTFDMRGNFLHAFAVVELGGPLFPTDRASDTDNTWTDPAVVDGHVHVGWTYDYYFKRFGRHGLDDRDRPIVIIANSFSQQAGLNAPDDVFGQYVVNAFWCDVCGPGQVGTIVFGNGVPPSAVLSDGRNYTYFAGALDIAAHELTHGVTSSTSALIYLNESGALDEAFSDIIGTSVEFFYQTPGAGRGQAEYIVGEDVARGVSPGVPSGIRSMADPGAFFDPDHYSLRFLGEEDNGGVHTNSTIVSHAFYLAIEGGTNRTSGLSVQGVGAANREQMERVFYRAFAFLLPSDATFSTARAATIQAARDLYGVGSAAERAVTQAWTAVGVL